MAAMQWGLSWHSVQDLQKINGERVKEAGLVGERVSRRRRIFTTSQSCDVDIRRCSRPGRATREEEVRSDRRWGGAGCLRKATPAASVQTEGAFVVLRCCCCRSGGGCRAEKEQPEQPEEPQAVGSRGRVNGRVGPWKKLRRRANLKEDEEERGADVERRMKTVPARCRAATRS